MNQIFFKKLIKIKYKNIFHNDKWQSKDNLKIKKKTNVGNLKIVQEKF